MSDLPAVEIRNPNGQAANRTAADGSEAAGSIRKGRWRRGKGEQTECRT